MPLASEIAAIADDLSGACDAAAAFNEVGCPVRVYDSRHGFCNRRLRGTEEALFVVNTQTRLASTAKARSILHAIGRSFACYNIIFKKIDSGLRGHLGAELAALVEGLASASVRWRIVVAPAIPAIGRKTIGGIQYDKSTTVDKTEYGSDPCTPVTSAHIRTTIGNIGRFEYEVCDAATDDDLRRIVADGMLSEKCLFVGSIGLARALAEIFESPGIALYKRPISFRPMIVSGSQYQSAHRQITKAAATTDLSVCYFDLEDYRRTSLSCLPEDRAIAFCIKPKKITDSEYPQSKLLHEFISFTIKAIRQIEPDGLAIIGGETAYRLLSRLGSTQLNILGKIEEVIPYGTIENGKLAGIPFAIKGGSVGSEDSVVKMLLNLRNAD